MSDGLQFSVQVLWETEVVSPNVNFNVNVISLMALIRYRISRRVCT